MVENIKYEMIEVIDESKINDFFKMMDDYMIDVYMEQIKSIKVD